jgi:protoporphyrinogen oxidase
MVGALSLILVLKEKFLKDNTYWLNINEPGFPFVFVDEHTNFVSSKYYHNQHLVYVGGYYPQNHPYFKMEEGEIFEEFLPFLKKINPKYDFPQFTNSYSLFTGLNAQPIVPVNYSRIAPLHKTPIPNIYLANMQQIYPWDRGVNYSIELGEKIAKIASQKKY